MNRRRRQPARRNVQPHLSGEARSHGPSLATESSRESARRHHRELAFGLTMTRMDNATYNDGEEERASRNSRPFSMIQ